MRPRYPGLLLLCFEDSSGLGLWQARFERFESLVHFLKQTLELVESLIGGLPLLVAAGLSGSGACTGFSFRWFFQALDLPLDHRRHFDAQVATIQQRFQRGNGGGIPASAEAKDSGKANRRVPLGEICGNLLGDVLVVLLQTRKTADGCTARFEVLSNGGPLLE